MGLDSYIYKTKKQWTSSVDEPDIIEVAYWRKEFNLLRYSEANQEDTDWNPLEIEVTPILTALYSLEDDDRLYLIHSY